MSGGSYNYFCFKDKCDLFPYGETLEEMISDMQKHSNSDISDVLVEMKDIASAFEQACGRVEKLHGILHGFEWWMSGDYAEDRFQKRVEEWRRKKGEQS